MHAKVLLIPSHHPLNFSEPPGPKYERAVSTKDSTVLTLEHLDGPLFGQNGHQVTEELWNRLYRNCLRALLNLDPFTSIVSIKARRDPDGLELARRDWAHIYYLGRAVAEFTHHTTGLHDGYKALLEWAELADDSVMFEWSTEQWREFFLERISNTMRLQHEKATALVDENQTTVIFTEAVLETLLIPA